MGQADHRHLRRHHGVGGLRDLLQCFQQQLPHTGQTAQRQAGGHVDATAALFGGNGRVIRGLWRDLHHRNPVGGFRQIAQHGQRVGPVGILPAQFMQRIRRSPAHDHVEQVHHPAPVGKAQHGAHRLRLDRTGTVGDGLIQQRGRISRRAFGGAGDQSQSGVGDRGAFGLGDLLHQSDHHLRLDPLEVKALAARQDGDRNFADLGGGEDEFDVLGRFFQRFQQGVEGVHRQHVHFVDDIDFVAGRCSAVADAVNNLPDVADPGARGGVHLQHVDMAAFGDGAAGLAHQARLGCRPPCAIRPDAVQPLGDDPGRGGFTGSPDASHDERVGDPVGHKGVLQRAHHRLLPDEVGKGFRPVFARKDAVGRVGS